MPNQIKSLSKGLKVYRFIVDYGKPILAVTLCEKLQIDKSTMSRLLKTLKDEDFISYLEKSNEIIANEIIKSENKNIFVMYWMLHYLWVYEILKKNDSKWRVENIVYFNPLK